VVLDWPFTRLGLRSGLGLGSTSRGFKPRSGLGSDSGQVVMVALWNTADYYIFALWFLLSFFFLFSSPNLSGRSFDVYHTLAHGVALVRI